MTTHHRRWAWPCVWVAASGFGHLVRHCRMQYVPNTTCHVHWGFFFRWNYLLRNAGLHWSTELIDPREHLDEGEIALTNFTCVLVPREMINIYCTSSPSIAPVKYLHSSTPIVSADIDIKYWVLGIIPGKCWFTSSYMSCIPGFGENYTDSIRSKLRQESITYDQISTTS